MPPKPGEDASAVSASAARVWMTTGLPSSLGEVELGLEHRAAAGRAARGRGRSRARSRRPRPPSDGRAGRASSSSRSPSRSASCGWMPRIAKTPSSASAAASAVAAGLDRRADREDPPHPGRPRPRDDIGGGIGAGLEVRVRVDHAAAAGASTRGKSGGAASIPSAGSAACGRTRSSERSAGWPSASRMLRRRLRQVRARAATATATEPVGEVVEHLVELGRLRLVLRELPRRASPRRAGSGGGPPARSRRAHR